MKKFFHNPDLGLLFLRIPLGASLVAHGVNHFMGGADRLKMLGSQMGHVGIHFAPVFWGFMAATAFALGGILFIAGAYFRLAAAALMTTMLVAAIMHFQINDPYILKTSRAVEMFVLYLGLVFIGPGKYSVDKG